MAIIRRAGKDTCLICGKPLTGQYYCDWNGNRVCTSHTPDTIPRCVSCHRFCSPEQSVQLSHGAYICPVCKGDIVTREAAASIVAYIRRAYIKAGLGEIKNWRLKVTDLHTMYSQRGSLNTRGFATRFGNDYEICVLRHLSRVAFAEVLAHEMLHIWQYNRYYSPVAPLCEGFCNMGSYYVLSLIGNAEAKAFMRMLEDSPDPVYGDGFRIVKAAYDHGGWQEAMSLVSKH